MADILSHALSEAPRVIVQGITGRTGRRHAAMMRAYGTRIVGGTSPRKPVDDVDGMPVFSDCDAAVRATGANASVAFVPATGISNAVAEAIEAGIRLVVTIAEGMPAHDAARTLALVREHRAVWLGPSTPGLAVPGRYKLGFLPDICLAPGPLGVVTKSGTLSYEICHRLLARGFGQSAWVGVGGETIKGLRFADCVEFFRDDPATRALVVVGEIGGSEEEELARRLMATEFGKPVFALIAGSQAPQGRTMGHAGALIHGEHGTAAGKSAALTAAGASVHHNLRDLVDAIVVHLT